jgi:hypothetical protein
MIDLTPYIEKELISKRFILAILIVAYFAYTGNAEGIAGTVIGYYFGNHQTVEV